MKITADMIEAAASALADMDNVPSSVRLGDVYTRTDVHIITRDWHRVAAERALKAALDNAP